GDGRAGGRLTEGHGEGAAAGVRAVVDERTLIELHVLTGGAQGRDGAAVHDEQAVIRGGDVVVPRIGRAVDGDRGVGGDHRSVRVVHQTDVVIVSVEPQFDRGAGGDHAARIDDAVIVVSLTEAGAELTVADDGGAAAVRERL